MEFATELVLKATSSGLRVEETPITAEQLESIRKRYTPLEKRYSRLLGASGRPRRDLEPTR